MKTNRQYDIFIPVFLFAILYACLLPYYRYNIVSDMVSYLTMSKHIVVGNFYESVNAYWSPMLSWLVAPFIGFGVEGVLASKIINFLSAIIILVEVYKLTCFYTSIRWQQLLMPIVCIHHLLFFGLCNATPDMLALACWFSFFNRLILLVYNPTMLRAIVTGVLASFSYFAKYYNFYAATCFFILAGLLVLYNKQTSRYFILLAFGVFAIFSISWIVILHHKFGVWSPTTASGYNMSILNPEGFMHPMQIGNQLLPIDYSQFKTTSWEYPPVYNVPRWNPFDKIESIRYHFSVQIYNNFLHFRNKHVVELGALGLSVLYALLNRKKFTVIQWWLLIGIVLYPIGYFWLIALSRYALFSVLLSVLWLLICINTLKHFRLLVFVAIGIGLSYSHFVTNKRLRDYPDKGENYVSFYKDASQHVKLKRSHILASPSCWSPAMYFCYYSESKLYDVLKPELLKTQLPYLKSLGIQYYFCKRSEVPVWLVQNIAVDSEWVLVTLP